GSGPRPRANRRLPCPFGRLRAARNRARRRRRGARQRIARRAHGRNRPAPARERLMLYAALYSLHPAYSAFNVMKYITFRTLCAAILSFLIAFLFGPSLIRKLIELQVGQQIRSDGPASHQTKAGTPTMGGTLILFSLVLSTLLLGDLTNAYVWLVMI